MKISIEADVLAKAMKKAASILSNATIFPICANVRLVAKGKELEVTTCDLEAEYRQTVPLAAKGEMATTVDAKKLLALASAAPDGSVLNLSLGDNRLTVTAGRGRWTMPVLPVTDFPTLPIETIGPELVIDGEVLGTALHRVEWAIYNGKAQMHLMGIFLHSEGGKVRFASANGSGLAVVTIDDEFPADAVDAMIAAKFASTLASLAEGCEVPVSLAWDRSKIRASMGDMVLTGKLMEASFPDYRRIIPADSDAVVIDPETVTDALRRVMVISDEKSRCVKLARGTDALTISAIDGIAGSSSEEIPAQCAEAFESGINGQFFASILSSIGGDSIEIHQADAKAPFLIRRVVDDGAMAIVMPMKI